MVAAIKKKFTAAWKAHAAAVGTGVVTYLLSKFGLVPEPDGASLVALKTGIGEIAFSVISGIGAWLATYLSPANTTEA